MFATNEERKSLKTSSDFGLDFVVRVEKNGRQSELAVDDVDHALDTQGEWIKRGAQYVEIFRVLDDGSLNPTIGAYRAEVA